jgi:hypothetical protein
MKTRLFETQSGLMLLLFVGMLIFAGLTTVIVFAAPANDKAFLLFSNTLTGFTSALLTAAQVKRSSNAPEQPAVPNAPEDVGAAK